MTSSTGFPLASRGLPLRWTLATVASHLIGVLVIGSAVALLLYAPPPALFNWMAWALVPLVALTVSLAVGHLQWRALAPTFKGLDQDGWAGTTTAGTLATTLGCLAIAAFAGPRSLDPGMLVALAAAVGAGSGLLMGMPQARLLGGREAAGAAWVAGSCVAQAAQLVLMAAGVELALGWPGRAAWLLLAATLAAGVLGGVIGSSVLLALAREAGLVEAGAPSRSRRRLLAGHRSPA